MSNIQSQSLNNETTVIIVVFDVFDYKNETSVSCHKKNIVCRWTMVESWNMPFHLCVFTCFLWGFVKVGAHVVVASIQAVNWRASVGLWPKWDCAASCRSITEGSRLFETAVPALTHNAGGALTYKPCNGVPAARVSEVCAGVLCPNSFGKNVNERYSRWFIHNTGPNVQISLWWMPQPQGEENSELHYVEGR